MILLVMVALAAVLSLALGGRLRYLAEVSMVQPHIILFAMGIQILIFGPWWESRVSDSVLTDGLYVASLTLIMMACWLNRHIPGIMLLGLGLVLNAIAIVANNGHMPAFLGALQAAGLVESAEHFEAMYTANSTLIGPDTRFWFLGDILAIPSHWPLANVYSIGDILILEGAVAFVLLNMRPPAETPKPAPLCEI